MTATLAVAAIDQNQDPVAVGAEYSESPVVQAVIARIDHGDFSGARVAIETAMPKATPLDARVLAFQRERMRRIGLDFEQDAAQVRERLRRQIPDLTDAEFARWDGQGLLERMDIDGKRLYFNRATSNLFRLSSEARARRADPKPFVESPLESINPHHRAVIEATRVAHADNVLPRRLRITQTLTVHADAVPAGETVSAWIPYPRSIPGQQDDIRLLSSEPATHVIAPVSAVQRTVHFEKPAVAGQPTTFSVTYDVTISARHLDVDADKVVATKVTPGLAPFVAQRPPHIVFTDDLKAFSKRAVGDETNPWRIAQKLFAAVDQIPWAGAREYSTISNISDYALHAGHADCGQQTLLLMTLLRLNGIPARWQSGMMFADNGGVQSYWNLHDWGQLYIAPYGWMPMDVTFGRLDATDPAVAGFYLGGLDGYRVAFNDDFGRPLVPAKRFARSETVDLQRGEAEWAGGNLYFDQWDYDFVATPQP
ncbi:transglutaminase domain-containing protein [Thermomonas sp.]|uniref:transglutaminase-like domain-containing protein n=1 Tax=Thermomonas sp. TaxID=1971895 RepID=UPI00248762C3|nr:transglutaminase domain-containing protein [Thermomonas sp.]MDI1252882.1 transglutaminase domain-containing protein [Thermomonas sp.]